MANSDALDQAIIQRFCQQFGAKPQGGGKRYKEGTCPSCGKRKFWIWGKNIYKAQCDSSLPKCGHEVTIRELFPDLFKSYSERFEKDMATDAKAVAKAYLKEERGFNIALVNSNIFTQETFAIGGHSTATVRFAMPHNGTQDGYWERFIDNPERFYDKARFLKGYQYGGYGWMHPTFDAKSLKEFWIVEGIFDALALMHHGIMAISAMSMNKFPEITLTAILKENPNITPVVALDSEPKKAQQNAVKWHKQLIKMGFKSAKVALTNTHEDWNDWHIANKITEKNIETALYHGSLLTAKSAEKKAQLMWKKLNKYKFFFEFRYKTYWFEFNSSKYNNAYDVGVKQLNKKEGEDITAEEKEELIDKAFSSSNTIFEIANCIVDILYFQIEQGSDERFYYLNVAQSDKKTAKGAFSPKHLSSGSEFKHKIMGALSGAIYTGKTEHLNEMFIEKTQSIKDIETVPYIGYCRERKAYIFNHYAVFNGELHKRNEEDYFELGNHNIKSTFDMTSMRPTEEFSYTWLNDFLIVFGIKGLVCLAFWFGTLFAEQIRDQYGAWPFLEITGEAGAGKSFLIEFLWLLVGRTNYEGINPTTASLSGRSRTFSQVSNLPVVLIESDTNDPNAAPKHKQKTFSFDEIKPLFNGRAPRVLGVKSNNNNTDDEPFRGSVVISQNKEVTGSEAILSRLIAIYYDKSHHRGQYSRDAAERLQRLSNDEASGFLFESLKQEKRILASIANTFNDNRNGVMKLPNIKTERIGLTHGLLISCLQALCDILPITDKVKAETTTYIHELAMEREKALIRDSEAMDQFWDVYEYFESLDSDRYRMNHSANKDEIAINLQEFHSTAKANNMSLEDIKLIKKLIPRSVRYPFIESKSTYSAVTKKSSRCYIFKKK